MSLDEDERILSRGVSNIHHVNDTAMVWYSDSKPTSFC